MHGPKWKLRPPYRVRRSVLGSLLARSRHQPANGRNGWKADISIQLDGAPHEVPQVSHGSSVHTLRR
jgi:hypothetical protein